MCSIILTSFQCMCDWNEKEDVAAHLRHNPSHSQNNLTPSLLPLLSSSFFFLLFLFHFQNNHHSLTISFSLFSSVIPNNKTHTTTCFLHHPPFSLIHYTLRFVLFYTRLERRRFLLRGWCWRHSWWNPWPRCQTFHSC